MSNKPISQTPNSSHDYSGLQNDRRFEELLHTIFSQEINNGDYKDIFDRADLKPVGADKGIDVDLYRNGLKTGGIQCKWVSSTLSKAMVSKEVIKFILHYLLDNKEYADLKSYRYFLSTYKGFAKGVSPFVENFGKQIVNEPDLEKWTKAVIKEYKTFGKAGLIFVDIEIELKKLLGLIKIEPITTSELDFYLAKPYNQSVIKQFWTVRTVIDDHSFREELRKIQEAKQLSSNAILQDFSIASALVSELSNEFDNMEGSHIERIETQEILAWINNDLSHEEQNNSLLLVGDAGVGKSVIMKDLVCHLINTGVSVVAIKSDKYAPNNLKDLEVQLNIGVSDTFWVNALYYWTYRSFPWSAFLKISFSTPINILKDQTLALTIESPCLK